MKVLSLFDGMSCGQIALKKLGVTVESYYASEVDKFAMKVTQENFPGTIQVGDVTKIAFSGGVLTTEKGDFDVGHFDLVIGGSPCQSISTLGDQSGLQGKSSLFYHWLRVRDEVNPLHWLLENVVGSKSAIDTITQVVGGNRYNINSALLTGQKRNRYYWTNIEGISIPRDREISLENILEGGIPPDSLLSPGRLRWLEGEGGKKTLEKRYASLDPYKASCLTARSDASWNSNYVTRGGVVTKLTPIEYERLQTVPDNYTSCVSNSQRYKMLGNGWTVDVIAHILKNIGG